MPFQAPGAGLATESLITAARQVQEKQEIEVGRWTVTTGAEVVRVAFRVLLSRQPTGPRLKPEGRPPL